MTALTFDAATSIEPKGETTYSVNLRPEYAIGGNKPNGGYLLACLGRAALAAAQEAGSTHRHVIAAGAQYASSPDLGPAVIETRLVRSGRTATQVMASISNDGGPGVQARFTLATLPEASEPYWGGVVPAVIPSPDDCEPPLFTQARGTTIRFDPATTFTRTPDGLAVTGEGEFRAWLVDEDRDRVDTVTLLYAADCLPPATAGVVFGGWVPTLDMTVYIRALARPGPIRLRIRAQMIQDGFADEVCEAWDSAGRLVMQSTQLVALRIPSSAR